MPQFTSTCTEVQLLKAALQDLRKKLPESASIPSPFDVYNSLHNENGNSILDFILNIFLQNRIKTHGFDYLNPHIYIPTRPKSKDPQNLAADLKTASTLIAPAGINGIDYLLDLVDAIETKVCTRDKSITLGVKIVQS